MDVGNSDFRFTKLNRDGKEEKEGKPIRNPARAELHIDSLDRYLNNGPGVNQLSPVLANQPQYWSKLWSPLYVNPTYASNNMVINASRGRNLIYGYFERIALTQFQLFYRCPMFVTGVNDRITIAYYNATGPSTTPCTVTFPQGSLTPADIADVITTQVRGQLTGAPATNFVCSWNQSIQSAARGKGQFTLDAGITNNKVWIVANTDPRYTRCVRLLGFGNASFAGVDYSKGITTANVALATQITYGGIPNFLYTDYIDVCSSTLTRFKRVKDTNSTQDGTQDVVCRIYLTGANTSTSPTTNSIDYGSDSFSASPNSLSLAPIINTVWSNPNWCKWSPEDNLTSIDFKLLDMFGLPLFWSSDFKTEFQATLTVSES